jgi:hypothetical protein
MTNGFIFACFAHEWTPDGAQLASLVLAGRDIPVDVLYLCQNARESAARKLSRSKNAVNKKKNSYPANAFLNFKSSVSSTFLLFISNKIILYVHLIHYLE